MPVRGRGPESGGLQRRDMRVDAPHLAIEFLAGAEQPAVVLEPMDAHLEAALAQLLDQVEVQAVTLGNKVEGRSKSVAGIDVRQLADPRLTGGPLDVMRQDAGEAMPVWPEVDVGELGAPRHPQQGSDHGPWETRLAGIHRPAQAST